MEEKIKENLIVEENQNNKDNDYQDQNEKSSDIERIDNLENTNFDLNKSQDSLISEESNDKLKKIF